MPIKDQHLTLLIEMKESIARIEQIQLASVRDIALGVSAHERVGRLETSMKTLRGVLFSIPILGLILSGLVWVTSAAITQVPHEVVRR